MPDAPPDASVVAADGVPADVVDLVTWVVQTYVRVACPPHWLWVAVRAEPSIAIPGGPPRVWGTFRPPPFPAGEAYGPLRIEVAGGLVAAGVAEGGLVRAAALAVLAEVVTHELAHYEQYRAGRPCDEADARRRMGSLRAELCAAAGRPYVPLIWPDADPPATAVGTR